MSEAEQQQFRSFYRCAVPAFLRDRRLFAPPRYGR